jgi:16S rRNA processing protein RimM
VATPDPADADALVAVGRVGPPRGVRGEVFVAPLTDAPAERFAPGAVLRTEPAGAGPLTVAESSLAGGKLVVLFDGHDDREAAVALRGVELFVRTADRPALADPDEFYDSDLVGLLAVTVDGEELGPVTAVQHGAGADQLLVEVGGRECLVPFVAAIVPSVDLAAGRLVVDAPDGLFEL